MKICGIDASTKKTGISLLEDEKLIEYRLLDFSREKDLDKRMQEMCLAINDLLNYYSPNLILCEDVWISSNPNTAKILARLSGAIYMWAILNNTDFCYLIPSSWRAIVGLKTGTTKREKLKKMATQKVKSDYGIDVSDDVAEAILIGASGFIEQENLFE